MDNQINKYKLEFITRYNEAIKIRFLNDKAMIFTDKNGVNLDPKKIVDDIANGRMEIIPWNNGMYIVE